MSLDKLYLDALQRGEIQDSLAQRQMLPHLQRIVDALSGQRKTWLRRGQKQSCKGIYLYGPVGVGKTYLVDLLYQALPIPYKKRVHFHQFMQQIDSSLRRLQGKKDPLRYIAADMAKSTRLLCLDEFMVHDIADAMILATLLDNLFAHDIVLLTTSNTKPDELYLNGLQRVRFLPAIELIKTHCDVLCLTDSRDYRRDREQDLETYFYPLNEATDAAIGKLFHKVAQEYQEGVALTIQGRSIRSVRLGREAVWFRFAELCTVPRSQLDYLEIAERFKTVFLSDIPVLEPDDMAKVILFMHFIDVMYDKGVKVIFSAAAPAEGLYPQGRLHKPFQRTISRLHEMQSQDYLAGCGKKAREKE